jgi:hypothetical protein
MTSRRDTETPTQIEKPRFRGRVPRYASAVMPQSRIYLSVKDVLTAARTIGLTLQDPLSAARRFNVAASGFLISSEGAAEAPAAAKARWCDDVAKVATELLSLLGVPQDQDIETEQDPRWQAMEDALLHLADGERGETGLFKPTSAEHHELLYDAMLAGLARLPIAAQRAAETYRTGVNKGKGSSRRSNKHVEALIDEMAAAYEKEFNKPATVSTIPSSGERSGAASRFLEVLLVALHRNLKANPPPSHPHAFDAVPTERNVISSRLRARRHRSSRAATTSHE